jgi:cytochrome P450
MYAGKAYSFTSPLFNTWLRTHPGQSDTVVATMHSCILALVLNPAIQARAHMDLDALLGPVTSPTFRLPTFADRKDLPYIDAILTESLRWLTAVPVTLPHATIEDDIYRGWLIPKGTVVLANAWVMLHDEEVYPDPFVFQPERYLGPNPQPHPGSRGCFGFGRR